MDRKILLLGLGLCIPPGANAQNLFLEVHGTYQFPIGGIADYDESTSTTASGTTTTYNSVSRNYGKGPGGGFVLGGSLTQLLGWEARFTFITGGTTTVKYNSTSPSYTSAGEAGSFGRYVRFEPAIRIRTGDGAQCWYAAFGPSLALFPKAINTYEYNTQGPTPISSRSVFEQSGSVGWGGFGALGYSSQRPGKVGYFAELNCTAQSWAPAKAEVTEYTVNGEDRLGTLSTAGRELEYVNGYTDTGDTNPDAPSKALKEYLPMSTWGIRAGIRFTIGRQVRHELELKEEQVPGR
jgi:hypothetical protein